jgi:hypothetical protein
MHARNHHHDDNHDLVLLKNARRGRDEKSSSNDRLRFLLGEPAGGLAALQPCMKEFLGCLYFVWDLCRRISRQLCRSTLEA